MSRRSSASPGADAGDTGIAERDDIALLVFVREGQVVRYVAHPRDRGDFAELKSAGGWRPAAARFAARAKEGTGWIVLVEAGEKSHRNRPRGVETP